MTTQLDGTVNFRDLGGLPLAGGGETSTGVLFRSDALHALTPAGEAELLAGTIGVIVDFRTPAERDAARDRLPRGRAFADVHLPLLEGAMSHVVEEAMTARLLGDHLAAGRAAERAMANLPRLGDMYVAMLGHSAAPFATVARRAAEADTAEASGVLIHCTAGKDRTGVCAAVLLDAVGVTRDAIVADYTSSAANLAGPWFDAMTRDITRFGIEMTPALAELIGGSPPDAIVQALVWLDAQHGGAAGYLRSAGFGDDDLAALRTSLTA